MPQIFPGRYAATLEGDFVVFLIGMRINRLLRPDKWLPVGLAMGRMIPELLRQPELGLLHADSWFTWRTVLMVQYWRSFDQLHAYAHAKDKQHLPAWAAGGWSGFSTSRTRQHRLPCCSPPVRCSRPQCFMASLTPRQRVRARGEYRQLTFPGAEWGQFY